MRHHSSGVGARKSAIVAYTKIAAGPSNAILESKRNASCRRPSVLTPHGRDLAPPIESVQPDLATGHEAEEQHERRLLGRQTALRFDASAEFLMQSLDHVGIRYESGRSSVLREAGPTGLPLGG